MPIPNTKVEIAFNAGYSTPAASRTWTDVSTYVEASERVTIKRGRQDEVSKVPPSRLTLTLKNRDGRFTPEKTGGAYYPNVKKGRPIRVTVTHNAVAYVRFLGYVDEWLPGWPDGTSAESHCQVLAFSRAARLGKGANLRSIIEEEISLDRPLAYYPLSETFDSTTATVADISAAQDGTTLKKDSGQGTITFGGATGPSTDDLAAMSLTPVSPSALPVGVDARTVVGHVDTTSMSGLAATISAFALVGADGTFNNLGAVSIDGATTLSVRAGSSVVADLDGTTASGGTVTGGTTVHVAAHVDAGTMSAYLDGTSVASTAVGVSPPASNPILSLGPYTAFSASAPGALAHVAIFAALNPARLASHAQAGLTGFAGESAGARIARYATYAGIPAAEVALDTGVALIGHIDTTGRTPLELMEQVAETENGTLFDARDGTLTFKDRQSRYTISSAFTLDVTAQQVEGDLELKLDDQFLLNDVTATGLNGASGRAVDQTSIDDYGYYRDTLALATEDGNDVLAAAQWRVSLGKDPKVRWSTVTVDVTNSATALATSVISADIGTRFTLSTLPDQAPAPSVDLFVEGYEETLTDSSHRVTFNTSPAAGYDVWTVEDPVFGQYDAYPIAY